MTTFTVHHADCREAMRAMPEASVDAIVTDPPYGFAFMGHAWDHGVPGVEFWREALRVAKPGAHLVAFGGPRTFHRLACAIEDAGFEIRDVLSWLFGSGFPKSHNGPWGGTALKPGWEPIILARAPLAGTVAATHAAHGTGALNVDDCRLPTGDAWARGPRAVGGTATYAQDAWTKDPANHRPTASSPLGRWPANVALDEDAAAALDAQSGILPGGVRPGRRAGLGYGSGANGTSTGVAEKLDAGGASRFFYVAKASRAERNAGLDGMPTRVVPITEGHGRGSVNTSKASDDGVRENRPQANAHPTVKPIALMRWLVRLVTPPAGLVLDPFTGSGSTGCAAVREGRRFVGCEREAEYVEIARRRIAHHALPLFTEDPAA